jgi:hypothetical protein
MEEYSKQFISQTDARGCPLEAVILQEVNRLCQTVAYSSRTQVAQEREASPVYELVC